MRGLIDNARHERLSEELSVNEQFQKLKAVLAIAALLATVSTAASDQFTGLVRVVDGDTLIIHGRKIRLSGIDAPEARQNCLDANNQWYPCGQEATRALSQRISGNQVTCVLNPTPDRYGRALGTCWFSDNECLQSWLVRRGWAVAYRRYSLQYLHEEDFARITRAGIWRGRFVMHWDWRRGARLR